MAKQDKPLEAPSVELLAQMKIEKIHELFIAMLRTVRTEEVGDFRAEVAAALDALREKLADQEILTEVWTRGMSADEGTEAIIAIVDATITALGMGAHEGEVAWGLNKQEEGDND